MSRLTLYVEMDGRNVHAGSEPRKKCYWYVLSLIEEPSITFEKSNTDLSNGEAESELLLSLNKTDPRDHGLVPLCLSESCVYINIEGRDQEIKIRSDVKSICAVKRLYSRPDDVLTVQCPPVKYNCENVEGMRAVGKSGPVFG